jgi:RHH-type proline utilization regulon transcriptional repressor/proline dehydrogenase/delta 1-pyrroline-5-carboxylate dehydrogenase
VLGIIRANDLDHAIAIQNSSELGLTGGIQSLDEHEVEHWLQRVEVGNAYVNRHITGAIVQRQPFGGWKHSSVGCGPKAGGPAYVEAFGTWTATNPSSGTDLQAQFQRAWRDVFTVQCDPSGLRCERNVLRYRPLRRVGLLVDDDVDPHDVAVARMAAGVAGVEIVEVGCTVDPAVSTAGRGLDRLRVLGAVDDEVRRAWRATGIDLDSAAVVAVAEIELRRWVREQSISWTRHRHGRLLP